MTKRNSVFDEYAAAYDTWFDVNPWAYQSEVQAVRMVLPRNGDGVDIGVGTGRFSVPFGIPIGVEPSAAMAEIARRRGITVHEAHAENLPFDDDAFDFALMVTTICFLDDPLQALREIRRILRPAGRIIIGMLDKDSPAGREYEYTKKSSKFYRSANFYSAGEVINLLGMAGYHTLRVLQTLFRKPEAITTLEPVREGHGEGLFVVISAKEAYISLPDDQ
ncbi:MAG: class I SAM-dependent methyltransferase [Nitrospirota bacterium]